MAADWTSGTWTSPPVAVRAAGDGLEVEAVNGSDFWQHTAYGFVHDNGHALLAPFSRSHAVEVSFDLSSLTGLFDQAGLFICAAGAAGADQWIKAGIEVVDDVPHVGAVVTHESSDWSLAPVPDWRGVVTIRLSPMGDGAVIRARTETEGWRTIRVAPLFGDVALEAGPLICAPSRAGLVVTFRDWRLAAPDVDVHADPP
jgi:regulation of enolase protein 1 (concanavalin A-like superfamily)